MATYTGTRLPTLGAVVSVDGHGLRSRTDLANHSPDGFEWGYLGSGPAQLALAILAHHLADDAKALELHQQFHHAVTARLPRDRFTLTSDAIAKVVAALTAKPDRLNEGGATPGASWVLADED